MSKNLKLLSCILMVFIYSSKAFAQDRKITFIITPGNLKQKNLIDYMSFSAESMVAVDKKHSNASSYVTSSYYATSGSLHINVTFDDSTKGSESIADTFSTLYGDYNKSGSVVKRMQVSSKTSEQQSTDVPPLDFYVTGTLKIYDPYANTYTIESFALAHNNKHDTDGPENWWIAAPNGGNLGRVLVVEHVKGELTDDTYAMFNQYQKGSNYKVTLEMLYSY